jgi:hypothetical protein
VQGSVYQRIAVGVHVPGHIVPSYELPRLDADGCGELRWQWSMSSDQHDRMSGQLDLQQCRHRVFDQLHEPSKLQCERAELREWKLYHGQAERELVHCRLAVSKQRVRRWRVLQQRVWWPMRSLRRRGIRGHVHGGDGWSAARIASGVRRFGRVCRCVFGR